MKPATKFVLVLLVLAATAVLAGRHSSFFGDGPLRRKALERREIALRVLGEYLAVEFARQQAIIVSNPFSRRPHQPREVYAFEKAGIDGLKEGWGGKVRLREVVFPELDAAVLKNPSAAKIDPQTTTPLSFLTAENAWDSLLVKTPDAGLVVSLIGLPANLRHLEIWSQPKPRFALFLPDLRMIGDCADVKRAFQNGKLAAIVLEKPGAPPESAPIDPDYRKEFDRRYLLVTPKSIDQTINRAGQ